MKKLLFLLVMFFAFNNAFSQLVSWSKTAKNMGDTVKALAAQNNIVAAVTEKGFIFSTDNGNKWTIDVEPLPNLPDTVKLYIARNETVYLLGKEVFYKDNLASVWQKLPFPSDTLISYTEICENSKGEIFILKTDESKIFKWSNSSLDSVKLTNFDYQSPILSVDLDSNDNLYFSNSIFLWCKKNGDTVCSSIVRFVDKYDGTMNNIYIDKNSNIYALSKNKSIFFANDSDKKWIDITSNYLPLKKIKNDYSVYKEKQIFILSNLGFLFSNDLGTNWAERNEGIQNLDLRTLLITEKGTLFVGTNGQGLYNLQVDGTLTSQPKWNTKDKYKEMYANSSSIFGTCFIDEGKQINTYSSAKRTVIDVNTGAWVKTDTIPTSYIIGADYKCLCFISISSDKKTYIQGFSNTSRYMGGNGPCTVTCNIYDIKTDSLLYIICPYKYNGEYYTKYEINTIYFDYNSNTKEFITSINNKVSYRTYSGASGGGNGGGIMTTDLSIPKYYFSYLSSEPVSSFIRYNNKLILIGNYYDFQYSHMSSSSSYSNSLLIKNLDAKDYITLFSCDNNSAVINPVQMIRSVPNYNQVGAVFKSNKLQFWDIDTYQITDSLNLPYSAVDFQFSLDNRYLVVAFSGIIYLYSYPELQVVDSIPFPEESGWTIAVSPDSVHYAIGSNTGMLRLFEFPKTNDVIDELTIKDDAFEISPNPSSEFIQISNNYLNNEKIEIYSSFGNKVMEIQSGSYANPKINISSLPTGLYFVKIRNKINKFIKL